MLRRLHGLETWLALATAWVLVFLLPFRVTARLAGGIGPSSAGVLPAPASLRRARDVARRISRIAPRFPGRTTCLVRALAGWLLLRRRGIRAAIRFGVRKTSTGIDAHAWLLMGEEILLGGEEAIGFSPMADMGTRGT
jgi:hypothetical protein